MGGLVGKIGKKIKLSSSSFLSTSGGIDTETITSSSGITSLNSESSEMGSGTSVDSVEVRILEAAELLG